MPEGSPESLRRITDVQIAVVGDTGTGKSNLVYVACQGEAMPEYFRPYYIPPAVAPSGRPYQGIRDDVPVVIDTTLSGRYSNNWGTIVEILDYAEAVVLTYACNKRETFDRLSSFWLPELRRLEIRVPVIVVGCKLDVRDEEYDLSVLMQKFPEIETCMECSALNMVKTEEVFASAIKAILHPTAPLLIEKPKL